MKKEDLITNNFVINENASIEEAMLAITDNQRGAVVVVDGKFVFRGIVSDGEIRRGMLHGATRMAPIKKLVNPNAFAVPVEQVSTADKLFETHTEITLIPVIDANNTLVDVLVRDQDRRK